MKVKRIVIVRQLKTKSILGVGNGKALTLLLMQSGHVFVDEILAQFVDYLLLKFLIINKINKKEPL
jgi:hypothetical protein